MPPAGRRFPTPGAPLSRAAGLLLVLALVLPLAAALSCVQPRERVLRLVMRSPVSTLDPQGSGDYVTESVLANVYDPLVYLDADLRIVPCLATSWTNPTDRLWRFELRGDVLFQDGQPFGAEDVKYTLDRALRLTDSWAAGRIPLVSGVEVLGERTVQIETSAPAPLLLNGLANVGILRRESGRSLETRAVGTGPYRVARFVAGREVALEPFDGHWGRRASWRRATFVADSDGRARLDAVLQGRADIAESPPLEDLPRIEASSDTQLLEQPAVQLAVLGLNVVPRRGNAFATPEARRAMALCLDRSALIRKALAGRARPASQLAPPGIFGHVPDFPAEKQDLPGARAALERQGLRDGFDSTLQFTERDRSLASLIALQASAVGIRFELDELTFDALNLRLNALSSPAFLIQVTYPNADASDVLLDLHTRTADHRYGTSNFSGYSDPTLDRLLRQCENELVPHKRFSLLRRAMESAMEARAEIPLCAPSYLFAARNGLRWAGDPRGRIRLDEIDAPE